MEVNCKIEPLEWKCKIQATKMNYPNGIKRRKRRDIIRKVEIKCQKIGYPLDL